MLNLRRSVFRGVTVHEGNLLCM